MASRRDRLALPADSSYASADTGGGRGAAARRDSAARAADGDMAESFRPISGAQRANEIAWRTWSPGTFAEAARADRPIFLHLTVGWCAWCRRMDETTFSDPDIIEMLNGSVVPIRVDADRYPHVQDRYIAGGWPTNAFLTPTGELLWSATFVDAQQLAEVAQQVTGAWSSNRSNLQVEIERRQRALEAARARRGQAGLVRRSVADEVLAMLRESADLRHGGFGEAPKFPPVAAVELLYLRATRGDADSAELADLTLDGMLAGELADAVQGGFFRYALAADWTDPRREKLLETNAALLRAYALGAQLRGRDDWRAAAERIVAWVEATLAFPDGLWSGSQDADDDYFTADGAARSARPAPPVDPTLNTQWNAQWIAALADAGGRLGRADWIERAASAFDHLLATMSTPTGRLFHFRVPNGEPAISYLLGDTLHTAIAALAIAQVTGRPDALAHAHRLAGIMERDFWADGGGFLDRAGDGDSFGLLRYRDCAFEMNADAARLFLDLSIATGERGFRACAERVLAQLSPGAVRYGPAGAVMAIAVDEYFTEPLRIVIVGDGATAASLRTAALAVPRTDRRVFTLGNGTRIGPLEFRTTSAAAAFVCDAAACSPALLDAEALSAAVLVPD
jgi:uncharacterized protein